MAATKWALLCGGDFYFDGTARDSTDRKLKFPNLGGCVRDVNAVYGLLVGIGVSPTRIVKLTATCGEGQPVEDKESWPTRENIVRELDRITHTAAPGDLVYLHYSGHGIRRDAAPPDPDGDSVMGAALVMTDVLRGKPYLTSYHLGVFIQKMVLKGLRVTLVLDSCYSGRGIRNSGITPRTVPDQFDNLLLQSDIDADSAADSMDRSLHQRDTGSTRKNWLSNPTGCTVLTACGPQEVAGEGHFNGSDSKQGALTHCLLSLLREWRGNALPSHARVVDHVKAQIRRMQVRQSPTLLGDGNYEFFGVASYVPRPICHVTAKNSGQIELDVGAAQGVAVGALYDVFPEGPDFALRGDLQARLQARVTAVFCFHSVASLTPRESITDDREWFAVLRQWALRTTYIEFVTQDEVLRTELDGKLKGFPGLVLGNGTTDEHAFTVKIDQQNTYEISQDGARLPRLPRIPVKDSLGVEKLAYTLSHVARFQALQRLGELPRSSHLQAKQFSFNVFSELASTTTTADAAVETKENETLNVSLTYHGHLQGVHVSLFCFTASWGIVKIDPTLEGGQVSIPAEPNISTLELEMTMEIPEKSRADDPSDITDVFMVFASSADHVSWDEICLDSLPVDGSIGKSAVDVIKGNMAHRNPKGAKKRTGDPKWTVLDRVVHTSQGIPPIPEGPECLPLPQGLPPPQGLPLPKEPLEHRLSLGAWLLSFLF